MYKQNFFSRNARKKNKSISQINVTPFVDVMLVLLIVFMITAPLLTVGVSVDLPKTKAVQLNSKGDPIVVSIKENGELYIQERTIEVSQLLPRLKAISSGNKNLRIYVRGDKDVPYGVVLDTIARIKNSGFKKVALVAKLEEN
ncbi:MAG: protein TolR [Alphaproteobacteria bacterium]|jgi:biopolymer transport protein TolR|nr:protein TolR [Alphaproteobacteria bacterium]MBL6850876.1 protein TolR [Alphaproteobacteria bacterium]